MAYPMSQRTQVPGLRFKPGSTWLYSSGVPYEVAKGHLSGGNLGILGRIPRAAALSALTELSMFPQTSSETLHILFLCQKCSSLHSLPGKLLLTFETPLKCHFFYGNASDGLLIKYTHVCSFHIYCPSSECHHAHTNPPHRHTHIHLWLPIE